MQMQQRPGRGWRGGPVGSDGRGSWRTGSGGWGGHRRYTRRRIASAGGGRALMSRGMCPDRSAVVIAAKYCF